MLEDFKKFLDKYVQLSEDEFIKLSSDFVKEEFVKDEIILEEGKICRHFYFFEEGLIRFFCNIEGEEITKTFAVAPYCFTSKLSFRNQIPAEESIQALDKTVVWKINFEQYKKLEKIEAWNLFMRKLINEIQEYMENRLLESKIYTAERNYFKLLERYPADLIQKIPLKYLASFLGIAPQSLSRIRNNLHIKRNS